jgi:hypothetical protein
VVQAAGADCASLLEQNLKEEKVADSKLTALAESNMNRKAARSLGPRRLGGGRAVGEVVRHIADGLARQRRPASASDIRNR